ncbi:TolC family protein [Acinetobacter guillouiae]|jgi:cobalt-zinc-cadmium efflux system outer membrane protein|uniref:TolC family protein n=1 Tax=Acinetobacter guillouiae TaxID=106649 RepID=A0A8X8GUS9_ACIGI|nr:MULTISPECIES: TolC family protein [Acinetobacter]MCF0266946.1 TolC family protein [Acinetobacter guillouiae]MCS4299412.1 cobalt-zinc-cadmium efflux system outer membrane protein [Acinetobacter guillouiae]MCW2252744.1 cobalt-zinc-cadmium efflux system outer membrane protein [Acinetobacter sp. BIGb0204]NII35185.1 cobalt-zinc-cadmium efflux system outer membrane protein [Acinetobacter sp. BIGb0196]QLD62514.1 TolC family protein [Acinetobacter sp. MYb10]
MSKEIRNLVQKPVFGFRPSLLGALMLSVMSSLSWADNPSQALTLQQAIAKTEQYQQTQNVWQTQQQIATANIKQAKLWTNPELSVSQTGFGSNQDQELSIGVSQRLDIFGERKSAQRLAQLSKDQSDLNQRIYQAQLELAVKYQWSQLAIFELERNVVQEQLNVSEENLNAIQKRYQAGSVAQVDVDRARLSHAENARLYRQADLQVQVAKQQLSNLWGDADKSIRIGLNPQSLWPSSTHQQVQEYLADNLFEKSRQLQVLQAKATVAQLKASARPNPTVNLGVNRTRSPETSTDNALVVGVSIPLNIFNRQQYGVQIAQAKQDLLSRQQEFYLRQNALQVGTLLTELQGLEVQFKAVDESQIPLAAQVQRKTLQGFTVGKFAVNDVQLATLQLQEVRLRKVQLLKDGWQRAIEAESLSLGIEPSQIMAKDALAQINQSLWQETQALPIVGGGN